ncbi:MAG: hypothetical protein AAF950_06850 [Pseudomonadota bacterium]
MANDKTNTFTPTLSDTPRIEFDWQKYAALLEGDDYTEAEKRELLELLWNIIVEFVSLGFGVHPLQQACGQVAETPGSPTSSSENPVYLDSSLVCEDFLTAAKGGTP